jgi:hypothetical protein
VEARRRHVVELGHRQIVLGEEPKAFPTAWRICLTVASPSATFLDSIIRCPCSMVVERSGADRQNYSFIASRFCRFHRARGWLTGGQSNGGEKGAIRGTHPAEKKRWLPLVAAVKVRCEPCDEFIFSDASWDLDQPAER